ncbi:Mpo1-like protein [Fontibacter flavus]|uniref:Mpo1-like protein n=1 Tax=Fontibacter flavus TaxID=654838 RepID=A0ABV6FQ85_9BACT
MSKDFKSLKEFYPYYLSEHQHPTSRRLHFIGTALLFLILAAAIYLSNYWILFLIPLVGYGFAWVGHFFFEKNKPATFKYPFYSLASDFVLFYHLMIGMEKFTPKK